MYVLFQLVGCHCSEMHSNTKFTHFRLPSVIKSIFEGFSKLRSTQFIETL